MVDVFPFPRITAKTPEGQIAELESYLIQFKETLEFVLAEISTDKLPADILEKLDLLGMGNREEELAQVNTKSLTVSDVCNSDVFKSAVNGQISGITFSVNYTTGNLDFETNGG